MREATKTIRSARHARCPTSQGSIGHSAPRRMAPRSTGRITQAASSSSLHSSEHAGSQRSEAGHRDEHVLCLEVEDAFLREHAGRWLPTFFRAVEKAAPDAFHAAVGQVGAPAVESELIRRGIDAEPLGPRARRLSVEADSLECASGSEPVTPLLSRRRGGVRAREIGLRGPQLRRTPLLPPPRRNRAEFRRPR